MKEGDVKRPTMKPERMGGEEETNRKKASLSFALHLLRGSEGRGRGLSMIAGKEAHL